MPIVAPDFRESSVTGRHQMYRIACPQVDIAGQVANRGFNASQHGIRDREQDPHAIFDIFRKSPAQRGGLGPAEAFLPNVPLKNASQLRDTKC
jgi:hypothetical protein